MSVYSEQTWSDASPILNRIASQYGEIPTLEEARALLDALEKINRRVSAVKR